MDDCDILHQLVDSKHHIIISWFTLCHNFQQWPTGAGFRSHPQLLEFQIAFLFHILPVQFALWNSIASFVECFVLTKASKNQTFDNFLRCEILWLALSSVLFLLRQVRTKHSTTCLRCEILWLALSSVLFLLRQVRTKHSTKLLRCEIIWLALSSVLFLLRQVRTKHSTKLLRCEILWLALSSVLFLLRQVRTKHSTKLLSSYPPLALDCKFHPMKDGDCNELCNLPCNFWTKPLPTPTAREFDGGQQHRD